MHDKILAVVLAAGKGTRLHSAETDLPKVLRPAAGRPLLEWVLDELSFIPKKSIVIVIGYRGDKLLGAFPDYAFAEQKEQLGTGHAVMSARRYIEALPSDAPVLICCGDMPLMRRQSYKALLREHF
jgi:bifunctional N-acetylglucosamine-1-phosphate-uridyltransferase/glucosamine-1-phosphate-acetyltransferase GlmU-like protein